MSRKSKKTRHKAKPRKVKGRLWGWRAAAPLALLLCLWMVSGAFQSADGRMATVEQVCAYARCLEAADIDSEEITPETWRGIDLMMKKSDGSHVNISLVRPIWWIEAVGAEAGKNIELSIPEMGVDGEAFVKGFSPCTTDTRKPHDPRFKPVTGTFEHENAVVYDLFFESASSKPLGVTPNHLIWSESRDGWVGAGKLHVGERVRTRRGISRLAKKGRRQGRHRVYNIEVHKTHNYYVSNVGILTHNACAQRPSIFAKDKRVKGSGVYPSNRRMSVARGQTKALRERFLGGKIVKVGPGKWRNAAGTRQFRLKPEDYFGHKGGPGHAHLEFLRPNEAGSKYLAYKNVHVQLVE